MNEIPKLDVEKTKNDIVEFVQNKVSQANADGLVIGLSGGIDSTVAAFLACEAVGKENVFGVVLPSTTTPTEDKLHGTAIAQLLGINYKEMAIDSILNEFLSVAQLEEDKLAIGNLKARIRMSIIYFYANSKNYLVNGTGNKSEIVIGYFTKHGDGACDIEPIGDLYKTDVYALAKYLNVPQEIIDKPPRAGLWNNQTDEDEIGMTYELLDKILYRYIEKDIAADSIAEELDIDVDEINDIIDRVQRNQHKSKVPESPKKSIMVI
ncbi:NAD+ synthase [uncultured Methanobrevibacter sp.]|uniref:NAD+ synthase n=1 Tax=uncultured Methanobrevibacter sp. TaxID=253161 RepID=UPI0025FA47CC|nr:NAD+ synthase [uncultured Methanobrevibacter sp.]